MIDKISRMEMVIQSFVSDNQFMGSVLVAQNGNILLDKGYGYANLEWDILNSPITKFRIGSLTKQFTAAAILLLEENGKLKLTDPIKKYMPDTPAAWNDIAIFNLLTHTSGIPNYTSFPDFALITKTTKAPEQQIDLFRDKPLDFQPGEGYAYNNSGYVLLGYLIERLSDQSYQDFMMNAVFKPLGMNDSGYDSNTAIISHRASGYLRTSMGVQNAEYLDMSIPYSAGSLYSTTQDLHRWMTCLLGGKFLSPASLKKMVTPFKNNYGLGVIIEAIDGKKVIHHAGAINGFDSILLHFPDDNLTIVSLSNLNALGYSAQNIAMKMIKLIYDREVILPLERKIITAPSDLIKKYVSTYQLISSNISYSTHKTELVISLEDGKLTAQSQKLPKTLLYAESNNKFFAKIPDMQIEFFVDQAGHLSHLILYQDGEETKGIPF